MAAAPRRDADAADCRQVLGQRVEELRIEHEFLLVQQPLLDTSPKLVDRQGARGTLELDGRVERAEERQAANVADEEETVGSQHADGPLEHPNQVVDTREVLDDRVQDDGVECLLRDTGEVVGSAFEQLDLRQAVIATRELSTDVPECRRREVGRHVALAMRGDTEEEQPRAAADLQQPMRTQGKDPFHRSLYPLAHVLLGNRKPRIARVPSDEVERRVWPTVLDRTVDRAVVDVAQR